MNALPIKRLGRLAALLLLATACGLAGATGDGTLVYRGGGAGKVVFDGHVHAARGYVCNDCHTDFNHTGVALFVTQKRGLIDEAAHDKGTACFACHNGKAAFAVKNCEGCHREVTGF